MPAITYTVPTALTVSGILTASGAIVANSTFTAAALITANGGVYVNGGSFGVGRIYKDSNSGMVIVGITGATYDFVISDPTGNYTLLGNPTGTQNLIAGGSFRTASTTAATGAANTGALQSAGGVWAAGNVITASAFFRSKSANGSTGSPVEDQIVGWTNTNGALQGAGLYALNSLSDNSAVWLRIKTLTTGGVATTALTIDSLQNVTLASTTSSSSTSTGALIVSGGLGLGGQLTGGGGAQIAGTPNMPAAWTGGYGIGFDGALVNRRIFFGDGSGYDLRFSTRAASATTDRLILADSGNITMYAGATLQIGATYAAGAPTATGYLTIKDSTGTSYKIPAVAA